MFVGGLSSAATVLLLRSATFDSEPHPAPRQQWVVVLRGAMALSGDLNATDHFVYAGIYTAAVNGCGPSPGALPFATGWYFFDINFTWNAARTSGNWVCTLNGGDPRDGGFGTANTVIRRIDLFDPLGAGPGAGWDELVIYK